MFNTSHQNCISFFYDATSMFTNLKKTDCCIIIIIIIIIITESAEKNFAGDFNSIKMHLLFCLIGAFILFLRKHAFKIKTPHLGIWKK